MTANAGAVEPTDGETVMPTILESAAPHTCSSYQVFLVKAPIPELEALEEPFQQRYWQVQPDPEIDWTRGVHYANTPIREKRFPVRHIGGHLQGRITGERSLGMSRDGCRYTMDAMDHCFLAWFNQRIEQKLPGLTAYELEEIILKLEDHLLSVMCNQHGIAYTKDGEIWCDICRGNRVREQDEIVVCDICGVAVHRRCYGVATAAKCNWICRPCAVNARPKCELCPSRFGAFKPVEGGRKWSHVSCALFVPGVKIGQRKYMEPICNLSVIPPDRRNLICSFCEAKYGCCVQCSAPGCIREFHVTCALKIGLVEIDLDDPVVHKIKFEDANPPKRARRTTDPFLVLCPLHMTARRSTGRPFIDVIRDVRRSYARRCEPLELMKATGLSSEFIDVIKYWKDKRLALRGQNLSDNASNMQQRRKRRAHEQAQVTEQAKILIAIRQSLESVRNLCYMVVKRERIKLALYQTEAKKSMYCASRQVITCTEEASSIRITAVEDAMQHKYFPRRPEECFRDSYCPAAKITRNSLYFENGSF